MKVIIENKIPFINGLLEPLGVDVEYLAPEEITPATVRDVDALFVRTRTRCNADLLDSSNLKFVATATIGTDHFDLPYLKRRGITTVNAPGCNAPAVAQYVWSVVNILTGGKKNLKVGVVGVGHVGSIVAQWGASMGYDMLLCDPPRRRAEGGNFVDINQIAREADIITFHTPLTRTGDCPTFHLVNDSWLNTLRRTPILINSARGPVTDTEALIRAYDCGKVSQLAIDTWEGEPTINRALMERVIIATPHIAGYSLEGKKRATSMVLDAFTKFFGLPGISIADPAPVDIPTAIDASMLHYDPRVDTAALKSNPETFESMRNNYPLRREPRE